MTRPPGDRPERPLWGPDVPRDVDDELADHLAEREAELRARGLDPETARARAREKFGDVATVRRTLVAIDESRERMRHRREHRDDVWRDLRLAARSLRRSPAFTIAALVTLALGIGATTAVFSVVDTIALRPLAYERPDRVVIAVRHAPFVRSWNSSSSYQDYLDWSERTEIFERAAAAARRGFLVDGPTGRELVRGAETSTSFFSVLGVVPAAGRDFTAADGRSGAENVAIVSHAFWLGWLGGNPDLSRLDVELSGRTYRVVGVLPASFRSVLHLPVTGDVWVPLVIAPGADTSRNKRWLTFVGRLRDDVSLEQARAVVETMSRQAYADRSDETLRAGFTLLSAAEFVSGRFRPVLLALLGAVCCLLLVACANVANLLLARGLARRREMAIRTAIGAGRRRLLRQLLTENLMLGVWGGAAGTLLAWVSLPAIVRLSPSDVPRLDEAGLDLRVLGVALAASVGASLLAGLLPALRASKPDSSAALRTSGAAAGPREGRARSLLMGVEVALTVVLLAGAGLLVASFGKLVSVDPGFATARVLAVSVSPSVEGAARRAFFDDLLARVDGMPAVEAAGLVDILPLLSAWANADVTARELAEDVRPELAEEEIHYEIRTATAGYFPTLGIPLRRGRSFTDADAATGAAIVSEDLARQLWGDDDPIGKRLRVGAAGHQWVPVVGTVGSIRHFGLDRNADPMIYRAAHQDGTWVSTLVVRTSGDPSALAPALRDTVRDLDGRAMIGFVRTMDDIVSASVAGPRFHAFLLATFAAIAATLAAAGLFGLIAYLVGQRTHEMGVRVALGARRSQLVATVVADGLRVTAVGVVAGLLASLAATRLLASLLFDLSPTDPRVLAGVAVLMLAIAAAACYVPARRVLRVDPVEALRAE